MKIPFFKFHANGNDFIIVLSENLKENSLDSQLIDRLCCRRTGIGADGLLIISSSEKYDFFLDYYNADGSWETLCANGSRCAVKFMYSFNNVDKKIRFETGAGVHRSEIISEDLVAMSMKIPKYKSDILSIAGVAGFFIDSGARHFVCESENLNDDYVLRVGRKIRYAPEFQPQGINVNFYQLIQNNSLKIKTYEKGVERIMLSCASGSAAVVFHVAKTSGVYSPVTTCSDGGNLVYTFDSGWESFCSEGPTKFLFSGEFDLEMFL